MTIQQLKYIVALDEERHFARAAEVCMVTQPGLTIQLKNLEEEIGIKIFDRNKVPLTPTILGTEIINKARKILREADEIRDFVVNEKNLLEGEVRVGVISTLSPSRGWDGSHAGSLSLTLGNKSIFKSSSTSDEVEIEYDFFYVTDNPSKIDYRSATAGNKNDTDCQIKDSTPFNIATFSRDAFGGCIGDFEVLSMNIPLPVYPETNQKCVEDIITLKNGWNWQYQFDGAGWAPFPSQFQEKASISFQLKDLPIHFYR